VLSILAEHPHRVKSLINEDETNEEGLYSVNMLKNGQWTQIVVDDNFPCDDGRPAFSKGNGREMWVLLLEKAWAKKYGSYAKIEAGFAENVMHDLTGAPAASVYTDADELWNSLVLAEQRNEMMAASAVGNDTSVENLESLGLVGNHSYALLWAKELEDS